MTDKLYNQILLRNFALVGWAIAASFGLLLCLA